MKLIGMLDSPYVRRVAISLRLLGLDFEHQTLSVFSTFDAFAAINPVVKAPTLVTDDGIVLMDSGLILEHVERLAGCSLSPADPAAHALSQRIIGLALAVCDKAVQIVYEHNLRPEEKRHQVWLNRIHGQLAQALHLLEQEVSRAQPWCFGDHPLQADITTAVAWRFTREMVPEAVEGQALLSLSRLSRIAEESAAFLAFPFN
ncbi:glutathione S-transferase family protein [Novosphingobium sp. SG707]|uniref:glutathione S-transferase family protein n=1 Tax=Novosphingobium sp. SG707 TaxID=2586996 RepID=UPI0014457E03|nr:glutathione S-transferase family protein [Novosphingobium sp. SG707]NKJ02644.1 glutathione S-transferase [Novosphingobium sp. SG707]